MVSNTGAHKIQRARMGGYQVESDSGSALVNPSQIDVRV